MADRASKQGTSRAGEIPPPLELACLTILWKRGEADVAEVREALRETRPLAYTTVMTVLERLSRKGMVTRYKSGRSFRYAPARDREEMRALAIEQLIRLFFDGSVEDFEAYFRAAVSSGRMPASPSASPAIPAIEGRDRVPPALPNAGSALDETLL